MNDKQTSYEQMATLLARYADRDAEMLDRDPERWQKVRDLDDWLVTHREDDTPLGAYRLKCLTLRGLYETWKPNQKGAA